MSDVNVTVPGPSLLDAARNAVVEIAGKTGEVLKHYGSTLNEVFGAEWWNLKGKAKAGIKAERARFVEAFEAKGYSKPTIDVYWQRVKEAAGYVTSGNRVKGSTDVDAKTMAELKTMINRIFKAEEEGQDCDASSIKGYLMEAFTRLGGDVSELG